MKCKIFKNCGSCQYINQEYQESLNTKLKNVNQMIQKSHLKLKVDQIIGQENPYHYRNKVIIGFSPKGEPGFYEEKSHRVIPYNGCLLDDSLCDEIILFISSLLRKYRISIYNQDKRTGFLRHILLRCGKVSNEYMVTIVSTSLVFPGSKNFVNELITKYPMIKTVVLNENKRQTSIVLGNNNKVLYGKGSIEDTLCGLKFNLSPNSFYQINHDQCEKLYNTALSKLKLSKNDILMDTYCGIGTIGMIASKEVKQVVGVELNKQAVKDAINNAKYNHISNIEFINADSTECMKEMANQKVHIDALIMDPPRDGSTKAFADAVISLKVNKVIYISCNPETQLRDLKYFQKDYSFSNLTLVDMFPFTNHVESIVLLNRK